MDIQQDQNTKHAVTRCAPGQIIIGDKVYSDNLIVNSDQIIENCLPNTLADLTEQHHTLINQQKPQILLFGTGETAQFSGSLIALFAQKKIGVEFMNSQAACRTFNVLLSEDREVLLALLPY